MSFKLSRWYLQTVVQAGGVSCVAMSDVTVQRSSKQHRNRGAGEAVGVSETA